MPLAYRPAVLDRLVEALIVDAFATVHQSQLLRTRGGCDRHMIGEFVGPGATVAEPPTGEWGTVALITIEIPFPPAALATSGVPTHARRPHVVQCR
jgi:hypothetical protein